MYPSFCTSSSKGAYFLKGFSLALVALLLPAVVLTLYFEPLDGDLTRIGHLAERDFGANKAQPSQPRLANLKQTDKADILVLGDSFSAENIWQSMLTKRLGLTIKTYHYNHVSCISDWLTKAAQGIASPGSSIVIIETVEREFISRFGSESTACINRISSPLTIDSDTINGDREKWAIFPIDPRHLIKTWQNHSRKQYGRVSLSRNRVVKADLTRSDLFSNRLSESFLYYGGDDQKAITWSAARADRAIASLKHYQYLAKKNGIELIVLVIPDKSSVYSEWIAAGQMKQIPKYDLYERLTVAFGIHSNILANFKQQAANTLDFYSPNDTHLSLNGFRYLSELLEAQIQGE